MKVKNIKLFLMAGMLFIQPSSLFSSARDQFIKSLPPEDRQYFEPGAMEKIAKGQNNAVEVFKFVFQALQIFHTDISQKQLSDVEKKSFQEIYQSIQQIVNTLKSKLDQPGTTVTPAQFKKLSNDWYSEQINLKDKAVVSPAQCKAVIELIEIHSRLCGEDAGDKEPLQRAVAMLDPKRISAEKSIAGELACFSEPQTLSIPGKVNKTSFVEYVATLYKSFNRGVITPDDLLCMYVCGFYIDFINLREKISTFGSCEQIDQWNDIARMINEIEDYINSSHFNDDTTPIINVPDSNVFDIQHSGEKDKINKAIGFYLFQSFIIGKKILNTGEMDEKLKRKYSLMLQLPNRAGLESLFSQLKIDLSKLKQLKVEPINLDAAPDLSQPQGLKKMNTLLFGGIFDQSFIDQISNPDERAKLFALKAEPAKVEVKGPQGQNQGNSSGSGNGGNEPKPLPGGETPTPGSQGWSNLQKGGAAVVGTALVAALSYTLYTMWHNRINLSPQEIMQKAKQLSSLENKLLTASLEERKAIMKKRAVLFNGLTKAEVKLIEGEAAKFSADAFSR